jgi:alkylation response protein AidB-like acyl-CoA dehydrogenase
VSTQVAIPSVERFRASFLAASERAATEIESTDRLPSWLLEAAAEAGVYRLGLQRDLGGFGLSLGEMLPYLEVAAMGPGACRMLAHIGNAIWRPVLTYGTEEQRRLVPAMGAGRCLVAFALTERAGGTGRDTRSLAVRRNGKWLLSGEKHLITFADRADWFLITVASDERRAQDSLNSFLLPRTTPGFEIDATQRTMGLRGGGHAWLRYEAMAVDDCHRLGAVGQGLEVALTFLDYSRISLSACMVGLARRALSEAAAFSLRRVTFDRPIADRDAVRSHLATMHTDIEAGAGLVRSAAADFDAGRPVTVAAATAKLFCLEMVGRVTDLALRIHGGYGYTSDAVVERIYRDARGFWFEEGTAEIQRLVVARHVLGAARSPGSTP